MPLQWSEIIRKSAGVKKGTAKSAIRRLSGAELIKQIEDGGYEGCYTLRDRLFKEHPRARFSG